MEAEPVLLKSTSCTKYLGILLDANGKCDADIEARIAKGISAGKKIQQILEDTIFGPYETEVFLVFRNAIFISTVLNNIESMYNLTMKNVEALERCDEMYLRQHFELHSKAPKELVYLETATVPIRFLIMKKRILYLNYLLNEDVNSLVYKFLKAQLTKNLPGDWVNLVDKDIKELDISLSYEDIKNTNKKELSEFLNEKIENKALEYLLTMKEKHSKMNPLNYTRIQTQEYLTSSAGFNKSLRNFAIQARGSMLDLKANFKSAYAVNDINCRHCENSVEDQQHLLECPALNTGTPNTVDQPQYEDLFSNDAAKIKKICEKLKGNMMRFNQILNRPRDRRVKTTRSVPQ